MLSASLNETFLSLSLYIVQTIHNVLHEIGSQARSHMLGMYCRGVNLYGLRVNLTDFWDLHWLTGVRCNPYRYLWFLQIQTYNHSTLYIRYVVSLQWHQLCFVNTKVNDLWHNKLCFVYYIWVCYSGILYQNCVLQWCWQFVRISLQIVRIFCHDLTDRSCPRLTPLMYWLVHIAVYVFNV